MVNRKHMAICAAAKELGIKEQEMKNVLVTSQAGFYEINFSTEWMIYDIFVEERSLLILGVDYRPVPVNTLLAELPESVQDAS